MLLVGAGYAQVRLDADKPVDAIATLRSFSVAAGRQGQMKVTLRILRRPRQLQRHGRPQPHPHILHAQACLRHHVGQAHMRGAQNRFRVVRRRPPLRLCR